jgi:hypothetical protein
MQRGWKCAWCDSLSLVLDQLGEPSPCTPRTCHCGPGVEVIVSVRPAAHRTESGLKAAVLKQVRRCEVACVLDPCQREPQTDPANDMQLSSKHAAFKLLHILGNIEIGLFECDLYNISPVMAAKSPHAASRPSLCTRCFHGCAIPR